LKISKKNLIFLKIFLKRENKQIKLPVTIDCSTENLRHQSREFFEVKVQGN